MAALWNPSSRSGHASTWIALTALALVTAIGGGVFFRAERRSLEADQQVELKAYAGFHRRMVESWRRDALDDLATDAGPTLAERFAAWLARSGDQERDALTDFLSRRSALRGYRSAWLIERDAEPPRIFAVGPDAGEIHRLPTVELRQLRAATGAELYGPVSRPDAGRIDLLLATPLANGEGRVLGDLVFQLDAQPVLDTLLRDPQVPGRTLETVLARSRGDAISLVVIGGADSPHVIEVRRPAPGSELPAAYALRGNAGFRQGVDFRQNPVLAWTEPIPGAPWALVTKIERSDVEARIAALRWRVAGASALLYVAGALTLLLFDQVRRKRVLGRAVRAEDALKGIFEHARDGIAVVDADGTVLEVNPAAARMLGERAEDIRGRRITEWLDPEDLNARPMRLGEIARGAHLRLERRWRRRDGTPVDTEMTAGPLDGGRVLGILRDVTERRAEEQRMRVLTEALERSAAATIVTDAQGKIEYVNRRFSEITGWSAEEAVGKSPSILRSGHTDPRIHRELWTTILAGGEWRGVLLNRRRNGDLYWWRLLIVPIADGQGVVRRFVGVGEDVTREREQVERLEAIQRLTRAGTWHHEIGTGHSVWTPEACAILGRDPKRPKVPLDEIFGEVLHPEDRKRVEEAWSKALAGGVPEEARYRIRLPDGSIRHVCSVAELERDDQGAPLRVTGVVQDVTESERAARELEAAHDELAQVRKMDALGRLAGGVAHDFNNLLGVVAGYSELLDAELAVDAAQRGYLREIQRAVDRGTDLTRQLLAVSRKDVTQVRPVDLAAVFEESGRMLRRLIPERIEIEWHLEEGVWPVLGDPGRLVQILMNLAVNARDAIEGSGRIVVSASSDSVTEERARSLGSLEPGDYVRLSFADDGAGMDTDTLSRIFEPFFTTKARSKGTGLGLAAVYGIVSQFGGQIRATSAPGRGTTISIWLRRSAEAPSGIGAGRQDARSSGAVSAASANGKLAILLVEDDPAVRGVLRRMLGAGGHRVLSAASPAEARDIVSEVDGELQLVVTDLVLPGGDGRSLARELRERSPKLPVLFISGYSDLPAEERAAMASSGAVFLQKPFRRDELERAVAEALRRGA